MRFLHAADLHLGLRITRFGKETNNKVREARFQALDNIVRTAREKQVEFVLIAGDLFDDNHIDATTSRRAFEILSEKLSVPVYVLPGNHDPLTPDSVWERPPWVDCGAGNISGLEVLKKRQPVDLPGGGTLWPCPLTSKTSLEDPTAWIPPRETGERTLRIGLAHGSLKDRPHLPEDDHLIDANASEDKGLDYLALGHWHKTYYGFDGAGARRTAYPGTHEPMRFRGGMGFQIGWTPYSNAVNADLFADDGQGKVLLVTIERSGAIPVIEEIEVGHLRWLEETCELHCEDDLSRLINDLASREAKERQLLRLTLQGVLPAQAFLRLDELANEDGGVLSRYCWSELNTDKLYNEPEEEELRALVGTGVLRTVYDRLSREAQGETGDAVLSTQYSVLSVQERRQVANQALLILYRIAQECRP